MPVSRRDFVENALSLAAVALAGVRPLASAAAEPGARSAGPSEKIRVAVIGVNGRGGNHLGEWLANPDADVVAICDVDPAAYEKHRRLFKDQPHPPEYVPDFRTLLDRKDVDVVSIATPNHWHALMAVWAMQAGKDVYVEKPCSHNVEEGRVIVQWARKLGRMCQMGAQSRSTTGMRATIDFVQSGKIGDVKVAQAICYKRPLATCCAASQEAPLRLALEPHHRQWRPRQPEPSRNRQSSLGLGQAGTPETCREPGRPSGLYRQRRRRQ